MYFLYREACRIQYIQFNFFPLSNGWVRLKWKCPFLLGKVEIYTYCNFVLGRINFVLQVHYSVVNLETHGVDHFF